MGRPESELESKIKPATLRTFRTLVSYARKHKIAKVKFGEIEFELTGQSFLSRKELMEVKRIYSPSPEEKQKQYEEDLFYSAL